MVTEVNFCQRRLNPYSPSLIVRKDGEIWMLESIQISPSLRPVRCLFALSILPVCKFVWLYINFYV